LHLNTLEVKIIGFLQLRLTSPLHVGSGDKEVRRPLLRLPRGEILIPSSTWKGAFRGISERLAKSIKYEGVIGQAIRFYREGASGIEYRSDDGEFEKFVNDFNMRLKSDGEIVRLMHELGYSEEEIESARRVEDKSLLREMAESYLAIHCPIGSLYGNKVMAGKVRFGDVVMSDVRTSFRAGVGIDRKSATAKRNVLYFVELIEPGTEIKLPMIIDNLLPGKEDSHLFALTLDHVLKFGLCIGGRKSAGLGMLSVVTNQENSSNSFYLVELSTDQELALGNPFKKGKKLSIKELIEYLRHKT